MILDAVFGIIMIVLGIVCAVKESSLYNLTTSSYVNKGSFGAASVS